MGVLDKFIIVYLITVFVHVQAQIYQNPYAQYGYQPYAQYPLNYNPSYIPYPYNQQPQPYQPYVSRQSNYYIPYYNYPAQSFPASNIQYNAAAYSPQNYYPYLSTGAGYPSNSGFSSLQTQPISSNKSNRTANEEKNDPYANIKTEIIDVEPKYFDYYKKYFNLEDNLYPINVIDESSPRQGSRVNRPLYQPSYIVKTESKQTNSTSIPQVINKHDVQTKTYSFKKTFTINPDKREKDAVINLNFVNGVEVTTQNSKEIILNEETTVIPNITESSTQTTTEREEPEGIESWF